MKTIWKYPVLIMDEIWVYMPMGAEILDVQEQQGNICLWALVDTDKPLVKRKFRVFGTGKPVDLDYDELTWEFIATVQNKHVVWHIFEEYKE